MLVEHKPKRKYNTQHEMYSVKGAENTLFYSTDLEWFRCILKVQNKMTPDVLKNVFASRFEADVVSVLEEKH